MTKEEILEKAKQKARHLEKLRQDARYLKTIGKLKREGLLDVRDLSAYRGQVFLEDALWVAQLEPRIYELLPAIVARRPKFFVFLKLPEDLRTVVQEIKRGYAKTPYHEVAPEKYSRWVSFVGRKPGPVKVMRAFRLHLEDVAVLSSLSKKTHQSQSQVLHQALMDYAKRIGLSKG